MDILDIFYNSIIPEACSGNINSFFRYNIIFSTIIVEDNISYICKVKNDDLMVPTLVIKSKDNFNNLLIKYVNLALEFYDNSNFCDEVINAVPNSSDTTSKEKTILTLLFSNATIDDFKNFYGYLQRRIDFFKNSCSCCIDLGFSNILKSNLEFEIKKDTINNETPYQFILKCKNDNNEYFVFPKINFGISNNKVYVYDIQNSSQVETVFSKKINRLLYKVGEGFDPSIDNYDIYGDGNLKDITPSFLFVLNIFMSVFKNYNYDNFVIVPYLIVRWNAKRIAIQNRCKKNNSINLDKLLDEQLMIQNNLTQKFIRTFLRLCYYCENINIINYPFEVDSNLILKLDNSSDKMTCVKNNSLLNEGRELVEKTVKKHK